MSTHGIFSEPTPNETNGSYDRVKHDPENDSSVDPTKHVTDHHPALVNPKQAFWKYYSRNEQTCRNHYRPPSRILLTKDDRPKTDEGKDATDGKTERS
jgi:hypothetical protein